MIIRERKEKKAIHLRWKFISYYNRNKCLNVRKKREKMMNWHRKHSLRVRKLPVEKKGNKKENMRK